LPIYGSGDFTVLNKDKTKLAKCEFNSMVSPFFSNWSLGIWLFRGKNVSQKPTTCSLLINRC
jgi:hypothetical protein